MSARNNVRAIAGARLFSNHIDLQFQQRTETGQYVAQVTWHHVAEGSESVATQSLDLPAAQELMDSLWQCGLRPSEGSGSAGALAATERHLADMRQIAFHFMENPDQGHP